MTEEIYIFFDLRVTNTLIYAIMYLHLSRGGRACAYINFGLCIEYFLF